MRIDSAKGALILLVVFGHMLEKFVNDPLYKAIYSAIYVFHMPLFVMISGMFSKPHLGHKDYVGILIRLVVPLILFQLLYAAPGAIRSGHPGALLQPYWILWFLLSLIFWKLALPVFVRLPLPLPVSLVLALAAGFSNKIGYALSLSRTFYFFPFFLAGFLYKDRILDLTNRYRGALAASFAGVMAVVLYWSLHGLPYPALWGSMSYTLAPAIPAFPAGGRSLVLLLSFSGAVGFLVMIGPSRILAYLGERSLTIYLLHGFVIKGLGAMVDRAGVQPEPFWIPVELGMTVLVAVVLAPLDRRLLGLYKRMAAVLTGIVGQVRRRGGETDA